MWNKLPHLGRIQALDFWGRPCVLKCIILREWRKGIPECTNGTYCDRNSSWFRVSSNAASLEEIRNTCVVCKNPATVVAIHNSLWEEIQSDNIENSGHENSKGV